MSASSHPNSPQLASGVCVRRLPPLLSEHAALATASARRPSRFKFNIAMFSPKFD
jgi:hypothetical protein